VGFGDLRRCARAPAHEVNHACQSEAKNDSREPPTMPHCVILAVQISILPVCPRSVAAARPVWPRMPSASWTWASAGRPLFKAGFWNRIEGGAQPPAISTPVIVKPDTGRKRRSGKCQIGFRPYGRPSVHYFC
jgi:hypothetical protein